MIQRRFYFPGMRKLVSEHILSYDVCQHAKADHHRPRGLMERVSLPVQKWQAIGMDWIVRLPRITRDVCVYDSVRTVTDRATKMTHFIPTWKEATAVDTADQLIKYIVKYHGLPQSIISDRDARFMSVFWEQLCSRLNIRLRPSSAFHPQTNGQTERLNGTIKQLLRVAQY